MSEREELARLASQATAPNWWEGGDPLHGYDLPMDDDYAVADTILASDWLADLIRTKQAEAWDEGFMDAAEQDHPAYPRVRRLENPYAERGDIG